MQKSRPALIIILFLTFFCCSKKSTNNEEVITLEDLLVKNNEITGWSYGATSWTANNISELTTYIDGLADVFQRYGFVEAGHQSYEGQIDGQTRELKLTIYKQSTEQNAASLYQDPDLGMSNAINWENGAGTAAKYVRYGGLSQELAFLRGVYYVHLQMTYDTEESLNIVKQFALNVDGKI